MDLNPWAIATIAVVAAVTFYLGFHSSRLANTTPDFLLARRLVRSRRNAAALAGDYLSASSFLGIAGLIMQSGVDALWYSVGCVAGYLALLLFVAAPLRRSGAYTLPDFAEIRLGSMGLRRLCTAFTVFLVAFYLLPQLQGAGLTLATVMPVPSWLGEAVVVVLVTINVLGGGMRAVTVVQAFQYWVKLFAIAAPTFVLIAVIAQGNVPSTSVSAPPMFSRDTTVSVHTTVELSAGAPVRVRAASLYLARKDKRVERREKLKELAERRAEKAAAREPEAVGTSSAVAQPERSRRPKDPMDQVRKRRRKRE